MDLYLTSGFCGGLTDNGPCWCLEVIQPFGGFKRLLKKKVAGH